MVTTTNMTDVMLRRSSRIKAGLEERIFLKDVIFCQEKDSRCNDKQTLQSNRTVAEQDLSFWPLAALLWNGVNVTCDIFWDRHVICF